MAGGFRADRSVRIVQHTSLGMFWAIGWLFSIGFLKLSLAHGFVALFLWPYYLGAHFAEEAPAPRVAQVSERSVVRASQAAPPSAPLRGAPPP